MKSDAQCDVLIVEDDAMQCIEMQGFLSRAGLAVETVRDATSGLARAKFLRPRVLLLDYNLPDMNGVQLAEQMRALLPDSAILMMSGRIDGLSEKTLGDLGITTFGNKPVPMAPLRQAIVKLVQASREGRSAAPSRPGWLNAGLGGTRR